MHAARTPRQTPVNDGPGRASVPPRGESAAPRILVVGDLMLDRYFTGSVDRVSPEAPVPILNVRQTFLRPGGAGNVAVNVAAMGGGAVLLAAVGTDEAGRELRDALEADGVGCGELVVTGSIPTTVKTRLLAGHNQIARFDQEAVLDDAGVLAELVRRCVRLVATTDVAVISDYAKGTCNQAVCRAVIEAARGTSGMPADAILAGISAAAKRFREAAEREFRRSGEW